MRLWIVEAGVPLRVITSAAFPVKAANNTPPPPPDGSMNDRPSSSIACRVMVVFPLPA